MALRLFPLRCKHLFRRGTQTARTTLETSRTRARAADDLPDDRRRRDGVAVVDRPSADVVARLTYPRGVDLITPKCHGRTCPRHAERKRSRCTVGTFAGV